MTYRHTTHFHSDYIDGDLDKDCRSKIDKHLDECPACKEDLDRLRILQNSLKNILVKDPGEDYFETLSDRVKAQIETLDLSHTDSGEMRQATSKSRNKTVYALRRLIQLTAAVTLLFGAFYLSGFERDSRQHNLSADIAMNDVSDSLLETEFPLNPETGINLTGPPYLTDEIQRK